VSTGGIASAAVTDDTFPDLPGFIAAIEAARLSTDKDICLIGPELRQIPV